MIVRPLRRLLTSAAALVLLGACGDNPVEPEELFDPQGSVSFSYSGALTGSYTATGIMELDAGGLPQLVTGATAYRQDQLLNVFAFRTQAAGRGDLFTLLLGEVHAAGPYSLDPFACTQGTFAQCRIGVFFPGLDPAELGGGPTSPELLDQAYLMVLGSVQVTTITQRRVRGTFQGMAFRGNEQTPQNLIIIQNGQFDLPIRPEGSP